MAWGKRCQPPKPAANTTHGDSIAPLGAGVFDDVLDYSVPAIDAQQVLSPGGWPRRLGTGSFQRGQTAVRGLRERHIPTPLRHGQVTTPPLANPASSLCPEGANAPTTPCGPMKPFPSLVCFCMLGPAYHVRGRPLPTVHLGRYSPPCCPAPPNPPVRRSFGAPLAWRPRVPSAASSLPGRRPLIG